MQKAINQVICVHHWEHVAGGGHAHDTARSADSSYDANDTSDTHRRRQVTRLVNLNPYPSSTMVWWQAVENYLPDPLLGAWSTTPASAVREALAETVVTTFGGAGAVVVRETVDGGLASTTSVVRNRLGRLLTQRLYRLGGLSRTTVVSNGLPTTFTTPEMGTHTLAYSALREPLAEASFETLPWWPVLTLNPQTGVTVSGTHYCGFSAGAVVAA